MRTKVLRGWAPVHACDLAWGPSKRRDRLGNRQNAFMANGKVALMLTYDPVRASATVLLFGVCLGIEARLLDLRTASSLTSSSFASAVHFCGTFHGSCKHMQTLFHWASVFAAHRQSTAPSAASILFRASWWHCCQKCHISHHELSARSACCSCTCHLLRLRSAEKKEWLSCADKGIFCSDRFVCVCVHAMT